MADPADATARVEAAEEDETHESGEHEASVEIALLPPGLDRATILRVLREGILEPVGRLATASNATLLCREIGRAHV